MRKKRILVLIIICALCASVMALGGCSRQTAGVDCDKVYDMDINVDVANKSCAAETRVEFVYNGVNTSEIALLMNSGEFVEHTPIEKSAFNRAYPKGASYGKVNIVETTINGKACKSNLARNVLTLAANKTIKQGSKLSLMVKYSLVLPYTNMRYGYNEYTMQFANFYPQLARIEEYSEIGDPFYSTADDYNVTINYPKQYKVVSSGEEVENKLDGDRTIVKYCAKKIRDYAFVLGLSGNISTKTEQGITVKYLHSADNASARSLDSAMSAVQLFSREYGEYGKKTFSMAEMPFAHGGMEYGDLIVVSNDTAMGWKTREEVIIHETAHQWWYNQVGSDQINHSWQDEGLTEFSVYYYFLKTGQVERAEQFSWNVERGIRAFKRAMDIDGAPIDENIDRCLSDFLTSNDYVYAAYDKGFTLFASVYEIMGDKKFNAATRDYCKTNKNKLVTPQDLYKAFDRHYSGVSVIMQAYLKGIVIKPY